MIMNTYWYSKIEYYKTLINKVLTIFTDIDCDHVCVSVNIRNRIKHKCMNYMAKEYYKLSVSFVDDTLHRKV